jgi:hypothetical protein
LLLLIAIGWYFFDYTPFTSGNETSGNDSITESLNESTIIEVEEPLENVTQNTSETQNETEEVTNATKELTDVEKMVLYIENNNLSESFHYFVIPAGETQDIVLGDYFQDPDNDTLFFTANVVSDNVSVNIWKDTATISANKDFYGITNATFTAEDPSGEAISASMTIVVTEPRSGIDKWWDIYGDYVIIAIIVLVLLALVVYFYSKIMKDEEPPKEEGFFKNF